MELRVTYASIEDELAGRMPLACVARAPRALRAAPRRASPSAAVRGVCPYSFARGRTFSFSDPLRAPPDAARALSLARARPFQFSVPHPLRTLVTPHPVHPSPFIPHARYTHLVQLLVDTLVLTAVRAFGLWSVLLLPHVV